MPGIDSILIIDYFKKGHIGPVIVEILYLTHLVSVFPIFFKIAIERVFEIAYPDDLPSNRIKAIINIGFMIFCAIVIHTPNLALDDLTNLNGSLTCFILVYLIPIFMHIVCYHGRNRLL